MFGLNENGFRRKEYADILESLQTRATDTFGEDINLSNSSFLGILISILAWTLSGMWQLAEKVYFSRYVDYSEGNNLDLAARNVGVPRLGAEKSRGLAIFDGEVPKGLKLKCNDIIFQTLESGLEVRIEAIEAGEKGNVASGCNWEIVTPIPNITEVKVAETTGGRDIETDAEFRARFNASLASAGAGTSNSIISALLRTEGVRNANIEELEENGYYKGIRVVALGGENDKIAQSVFEYKAFGIKTIGSNTGTAIANNGNSYTINFDYATEVPVEIKVTVISGEAYPTNGDELVKANIEEYINSLSMGDDVIYTRVIRSALDLVGIRDVDITINGSTENITIALDEVADANVVVS